MKDIFTRKRHMAFKPQKKYPVNLHYTDVPELLMDLVGKKNGSYLYYLFNFQTLSTFFSNARCIFLPSEYNNPVNVINRKKSKRPNGRINVFYVANEIKF